MESSVDQRLSLLLDSHQDRLEETLNKIEKSLNQ